MSRGGHAPIIFMGWVNCTPGGYTSAVRGEELGPSLPSAAHSQKPLYSQNAEASMNGQGEERGGRSSSSDSAFERIETTVSSSGNSQKLSSRSTRNLSDVSNREKSMKGGKHLGRLYSCIYNLLFFYKVAEFLEFSFKVEGKAIQHTL